MTDLGHVYWLGGGTGAGKSTISRRLADRYGLRRYDTDRAPERALGNLLDDRMFTQRLAADIEHLDLTGLVVDVDRSEAELAAHVAESFGLTAPR